MEKSSSLFQKSIIKKMYRDDGFNVHEGKLTTYDIVKLYRDFQNKVNELTESEYLKFTFVL